MSLDLSQFRATFFEEAGEHLLSMESGLLALVPGANDPEQLNAIFRSAHSIKGAAASLGFQHVAAFTHTLESLLDRMRSGEFPVTEAAIAALLTSSDTLRALVDASRVDDAGAVDTRKATAALATLTGAGAEASAHAAPVAATPLARAAGRDVEVRFVPHPSLFLTGQDPLLVVRELVGLGERSDVTCDSSRLPSLDELDPEQCYLAWTIRLHTTATRELIEEAFLFIEDDCHYEIRDLVPAGDVATQGDVATAPAVEPAPVAADGTAAPASAERRRGGERRAVAAPELASIRVPIDKVDALVDLVGELVIAQAMVNEIVANFHDGSLAALQDALGALDRNTRELQERVMSVRMLPVGTVFNRFPRLVHDLSSQLGKRVRLVMEGEETELDKGMIERLGDPLTHLVRNAIDHGLELPEARRAAGKREEGTVTLRAAHEGGNVVIDIVDDGKGLDAARIRDKAIANGLVRADELLSAEDTYNLIFLPGFSTAAVVSDVSGRGVGMDVVKRNVEAMNGSVTIQSEAGHGSRFRLRLPLTLAILDGLVVKVGGTAYVVPLLSVVASLRPGPRDVRAILGQGEVLVVRGESIPFVRLHALFNHPEGVVEPSQGIIVVLETEERRFGVLVDEVVGQQQVVIKNLETNFRKLDAIMGATILGDGRISLITDVQELFRIATNRRALGDVAALAAVGAHQAPDEDFVS